MTSVFTATTQALYVLGQLEFLEKEVKEIFFRNKEGCLLMIWAPGVNPMTFDYTDMYNTSVIVGLSAFSK
jgi:hypothetical protein